MRPAIRTTWPAGFIAVALPQACPGIDRVILGRAVLQEVLRTTAERSKDRLDDGGTASQRPLSEVGEDMGKPAPEMGIRSRSAQAYRRQ
jgi:hypothetical protein